MQTQDRKVANIRRREIFFDKFLHYSAFLENLNNCIRATIKFTDLGGTETFDTGPIPTCYRACFLYTEVNPVRYRHGIVCIVHATEKAFRHRQVVRNAAYEK